MSAEATEATGPMRATLEAMLAAERAELARDAAEAEWRWRLMEGAPESELESMLERVRARREESELAWRAYVSAAMRMHAHAVDRPVAVDPRCGE